MVICMRTKFMRATIRKLEERSKRKVPEAICYCLQTLIVVILNLMVEYIMYTKFHSQPLPFVSRPDT